MTTIVVPPYKLLKWSEIRLGSYILGSIKDNYSTYQKIDNSLLVDLKRCESFTPRSDILNDIVKLKVIK